MRSVSRLPKRWPMTPAHMAPITVPNSAMNTVTPLVHAVRWYKVVSDCSVPAITAVSKPKSRPPSAPTKVALINVELSFMHSPGAKVQSSEQNVSTPRPPASSGAHLEIVRCAHGERQQARAQNAGLRAEFGRLDVRFCRPMTLRVECTVREPIDVAAMQKFLKHFRGEKVPCLGDSSTNDVQCKVQCVDQRREADSQRTSDQVVDLLRARIARAGDLRKVTRGELRILVLQGSQARRTAFCDRFAGEPANCRR